MLALDAVIGRVTMEYQEKQTYPAQEGALPLLVVLLFSYEAMFLGCLFVVLFVLGDSVDDLV